MGKTRQLLWLLAITAAISLDLLVLNWLLFRGRRPWSGAIGNTLMLQGMLPPTLIILSVPLLFFRRTRRGAAIATLASFGIAVTTGVSVFIWGMVPAALTGSVMNRTEQSVEELVFTLAAGDTASRLKKLAPAERRAFPFNASWGRGSMTVRVRTVKGQEAVADCNTYINWALKRADYDVEISGDDARVQLRCVERWTELKF